MLSSIPRGNATIVAGKAVFTHHIIIRSWRQPVAWFPRTRITISCDPPARPMKH